MAGDSDMTAKEISKKMPDCPRCGKPVKGFGKTGMCQSCAASCTNRRLRIWRNQDAQRKLHNA
jgi:NMD protein affecting ribosome stability and mRNA decay